MEKYREGYEWKECATGGGYWVKVRGNKHDHKLSFFCPHCRKISGQVDDAYLLKYGFCWECFTMNVENRQTPTIDLEYYKNLKERG